MIWKLCVNSLRVYVAFKGMIPQSTLIFVHPKVIEEANLVPVRNKKGRIVFDDEGSPMLRVGK
jgi:hypothetical protein